MKVIVYNGLRTIRLILNATRFSVRLWWSIMTYHRDVRVSELLHLNLRALLDQLQPEGSITRTTADSRAIYEDYGPRELEDHFSKSSRVLENNLVKEMSFKEQRSIHLSYVFAEIDQLLLHTPQVRILEVGCGNGINLAEIIAHYGDRVSVFGIDVSGDRIRTGREFLGDQLLAASMRECSITEPIPFASDEFHLVYSMFCLEQIAYDVRAALEEMYRVCLSTILMIEPVFENGTLLSRIYLVRADHTRVLLKAIMELGLPLIRNEILPLQFNPSNQSSLLVVKKPQFNQQESNRS